MKHRIKIIALAITGLALTACVTDMPAQVPIDTLDDAAAGPIKPPMPIYPDAAIQLNLAGNCVLSFDVTTKGKPKSITSRCTSAEFCQSSLVATEEIRFAPLLIDGKPIERTGVEYPLSYSIDTAEPIADDAPLLPCT